MSDKQFLQENQRALEQLVKGDGDRGREKKQRRRDLLLVVLFCVFLASMLLAFYLLPKEDFSTEEKRALAKAPDFTLKAVMEGDFEEQTERYVSDHFPGRKFFVGLDAYYALYSGRNGSNGIYRAKNGYLINTPVDWNQENFTRNMTHIRDFVRQTGLPGVMMLVPSAGYVEESLLPWNHDVYPDGQILDQAQSLLEGSGISWVDLANFFREGIFYRGLGDEEYLSQAREKAPAQKEGEREDEASLWDGLYYKTDHHWTSTGAYLAYCKAAEHLNFSPIERMAFSISRYDGFYGTSYAKSALWGEKPDHVEVWKYPAAVTVEIHDDNKQEVITSNSMFFWERLSEPDMYQVFLDGNHSLVKITNHSQNQDKKLLVIKDSFGHAITPFLANHYKEVYMVDLRYYRQTAVSEIIEREGIDQILVVYSVDNIVNDTNIPWLR